MDESRLRSILGFALFAAISISSLLFLYDVLFSKPDHQQGLIIEKIFVEGRSHTGATPYGGIRRANYSVTVQKEEQWIAVVKMDNGDTLQVHCHADQYNQKNVGDVIHFKKYEGNLLHVQYFAHNEEED